METLIYNSLHSNVLFIKLSYSDLYQSTWFITGKPSLSIFDIGFLNKSVKMILSY